MRIIKPYGRTHVVPAASGKRERLLRTRTSPNEMTEVANFATSHAELVIAQWISVIDKIATKPRGKNGPTDEQRQLRKQLGQTAWSFILSIDLLPETDQPGNRAHLEKLWASKIEPYGDTPYRPSKFKSGPSARGRWYSRFAGERSPIDADISDIVRQIHKHLYQAEYRLGSNVLKRRGGQIALRAKSIERSVASDAIPSQGGRIGWTADDCRQYERAGDVAREIQLAAQMREQKKDGSGLSVLTNDVAGAALYAHYARVFRSPNGDVLKVAQAKDTHPGLFNLHMAVKDCYARTLKRTKREKSGRPAGSVALENRRDKRSASQDERSTLFRRLPADMEALYVLLENKAANRDLASLVRLGKTIHYEASLQMQQRQSAHPLVADTTQAITRDWPTDLASSCYWNSRGQTEIKFNEALVRVWRHTIAIASRTVADWADPNRRIEGPNVDLLLKGAIDDATGPKFEPVAYTRKVPLLFGNRAQLFLRGADTDYHKEILRFALEALGSIRHTSFHFKGLGGFIGAVMRIGEPVSERCKDAIRELWEVDVGGRAQQLLETISAANAGSFFDGPQIAALISAISTDGTGAIPLPRFNRLLDRLQNAWREGDSNLGFPAPANRVALEDTPLRCQYITLKLLYERAFRSWLEKQKAEDLNCFIVRAIDRSTAAARDINSNDTFAWRELIVARAANLGLLHFNGDVREFFFALFAETASEMRVQRGYESDPDKAREQAAYIEKFKCDVIGLAFHTYLHANGFEFVLKLTSESQTCGSLQTDVCAMNISGGHPPPTTWQTGLYFLLHLMPVDDVGKLLHQLRKSAVLAHGDRDDRRDSHGATSPAAISGHIDLILSVFELYLDMHDAKYSGGSSLEGTEPLRDLFDPPELFDLVFPAQAADHEDSTRIPRRGLREMMRFGQLATLMGLFSQYRISSSQVNAYLAAQQATGGKSQLALQHAAREQLHKLWTEQKDKFGKSEVKRYVETLVVIAGHRYLASSVTLGDHVRLHRLLMTILGRLVDFSGLWERDLYFVTLAIMRNMNVRPEDAFSERGLSLLGQGRITDAVRRGRQLNATGRRLAQELTHYFGSVSDKRNRWVEIRNAFAHFSAIKMGVSIDLTARMNDARTLMSYDRKLQNAVSQSIKDLLHREGFDIEWNIETGPGHSLGSSVLSSRQIRHLGRAKLLMKAARGRPQSFAILENLHSGPYTAMVAALFNRCQPLHRRSVADIHLSDVDWDAPGGKPGLRHDATQRSSRGSDARSHSA